MNEKLEILIPEIFDKKKIRAGIIKRNINFNPPYGFSVTPSDFLSLEDAIINRKFLAKQLGCKNEKGNEIKKHFKFQKQVHSTEVVEMFPESDSFDYLTQEVHDGMFTSFRDIFLCVTIADCCAILIHDPIKNIVSAIHSGWRGTIQNITKNGINKLIEKYKSKPPDLKVYLSPAASGRCFEVGWDVAKYFPESIIQINRDKYLFDNRAEIRRQLLDLGVTQENIESSDICTISNSDYHSYRRDKDKSGRMVAFISMIPEE